MAAEIRFTQGATIGTWAQAFTASTGSEVIVEGRANGGGTVIGSWRIEALYAHDDSSVIPTPSTPVVLAENSNSATPTTDPGNNISPSNPGAYLIRLTTWPSASFAGVPEFDYRELRINYEVLGICAPAPVIVDTWQTAITAQEAAGEGRHDNLAGYVWGWGGAPAGSGLARLYEVVEKLEQIRIPLSTAFSSSLTLDRSRISTYSGADTNVVLTAGAGPHEPGAIWSIVFPQGTITGANTVTIASTLHPSGEAFDVAYDYRVDVIALSSSYLIASARLEPPTDAVAPTISSATVEDADRDALIVVFSENVLFPATTGFTLSGVAETITGVSGANDTWSLALSSTIEPSDTFSLVWDGTNVVTDIALNPLAASSISATNNTAYPTISTAATNSDGSALTIVFSEAVTATGITGLSLSGTSAAFSSVTSGSGTDTIVFALSPSVQAAETVTMDVAATNDIDDLTGLALQTVSGQSVTNNVSAGNFTFDADILFGYSHASNSGATVVDDYGPSNQDATLPNGGTTTATPPAPLATSAIALTRASSQWIQCPIGAEIPRGTGDFSIMHAVYMTDLHAADLVAQMDGTTPEASIVYFRDGSSAIWSAVGNWAANITGAVTFVLNTWHIMCLARVSGVGYIYLDDMTTGNHVATGDLSAAIPGTPGADRCNFFGTPIGENSVDGYGGPIVVVDRALTQAERVEVAVAWGLD